MNPNGYIQKVVISSSETYASDAACSLGLSVSTWSVMSVQLRGISDTQAMRKYSADADSMRQVLLNQILIAGLLGSLLGRKCTPCLPSPAAISALL